MTGAQEATAVTAVIIINFRVTGERQPGGC